MSLTRKTLRASATLSTTANGADVNVSKAGVPTFKRVILNVITANKTSSASLTVKIQGKALDGTYYDLPGAVTAAITTNTTTTLIVGPGLTASANAVANVPLPPIWRPVYTISGGNFDVALHADLCA